MEDYSGLGQQVIEVHDDNDPDPDKISQTNNTTTADIVFNWTGIEGILCPWLEKNLPDTPASFKNYYQE